MDVIVYDDEFTAFGDKIIKYGDKMEDILSRYIVCMEKLGTEGFEFGFTSNSIKKFVISVSVLKGDIDSITKCVKHNCINYIDRLDDADDFLY